MVTTDSKQGLFSHPLEWRDDILPVSTRFDDPYFSEEDGRAETRHVFLRGNGFPLRWQGMKSCHIAELGFGTGLNFLETVHQWLGHRAETSQLNFTSFEQYPLNVADIKRALSVWPELTELTGRLTAIWSEVANIEKISVEFENRVHLVIFIGDANDLLPQQTFAADAWYLDGFSPAKNPELWNAKLMAQVAAHTVANGTFATYTAAGFVRRNLEAAGFDVEKTKGFGRKREMLTGKLPNDIDVASGH